MRYTFIIYKSLHPKEDKMKEFEMFLIETYTDVLAVMQKVIGVNLSKNIFDSHALGTKIGNTIIPSFQQHVLNPVTIGNRVYFDLLEGIQNKKTFIMNSKGGYQPLLKDMNEIGWIEQRREQREKLIFNIIDKYIYTNKN